TEALYSRGLNAIQLGPRERADCDAGEIRMRIEVARFASQRRAILLSIYPAREQPERRLDHKPNAGAVQSLVIPRSLQREQAKVHRELDAKRQIAGGRDRGHLVISKADHTSSPAAKNQRTWRTKCNTF